MSQEPNFEGMPMHLPGGSTQKQKPVTTNTTGVSTTLITLILAVGAIIIVGGFYLYKSMQVTPVITPPPLRPTLETNREPETPTATAQVESFGALSTSDELSTIEADLESTNLDTLDSELNDINAELEATE